MSFKKIQFSVTVITDAPDYDPDDLVQLQEDILGSLIAGSMEKVSSK